MLQRVMLNIGMLVIGLVLIGCSGGGPHRNAVKGMVKYKGEPIKAGSINFRSEGDGKYVGSAEIREGQFDILQQVGLPAGKYDIAISYPDPKVPVPKGDEPPGVAKTPREMLPEKYNEKSELKKEIKDGTNQLDFDLK